MTDEHGRYSPGQLILSTNYDEPLKAYLNELYDVGQDALHRIYEHCVGYPEPAHRSREAVTAYLRAHDVGYDTLYVGTRGRTVTQIRREDSLRAAIQEFLDDQRGARPSGSSRPVPSGPPSSLSCVPRRSSPGRRRSPPPCRRDGRGRGTASWPPGVSRS